MGSARPTILVVEDNPVEQKVVSVLAERFGVDVQLAANAYKALQLIAGDDDYAAVFINYMLPAMKGPECAERIRQLGGRRQHIPIIALTARMLEDSREECLASGMDDYLSKPYTVAEFKNVLDRWVHQQMAGAQGRAS